ncbi:2-aminoadipate aminotransferase [Bordetella holmesii]|nr:2-aminoadipate aminotransferase [Bordetella holmesii]
MVVFPLHCACARCYLRDIIETMHAQPLYQRLAEYYRAAIQSGALPPAARIPSVRTMVRTHQVSLSTALQVCRRLEDDGLVEARPRSGYFVRRNAAPRLAPATEPDMRAAADPAQYVGIHDRVSNFVALCEQHTLSINFALAAAEPAAYPHHALRQAMSRALRLNPELLTSRAPPRGAEPLRRVLAHRAMDCGIRATSDDIVVTHGCIEALNLALRAIAQPGDTIAVESPTYFGLLQILESLGLRALEIPTSPQRGLSVEALELALRTQPGIRAVVVVPNLQNPLGCVMPDADKQRLLHVCVESGIALIEDDTYGALADGGPQRAIKHWDAAGNVIYCSSLHKTLAPGMRLGWIMGGRWHARIDMIKFAQSRPNEAAGQLAAAAYMATKAFDRHLVRLRGQLTRQRQHAADTIAREFPPGTRLNLPPGGMLLWVELPQGVCGTAVFEAALQAGIRVAPGTMFSNSGRYDHYLRLSCAEADPRKAEQAIAKLAMIVISLQK